MEIDKGRLRHFALAAQGLDGSWDLPTGKEGVAQAIERLGHVQIDTISVVERAHHHILWTRCPDYTGGMLHELQACDRRVFEWWHRRVACYLPMADFRFHRQHFPKLAKKDYSKVARHVANRIRKEGALGSGDFRDHSGRKRGPWWDWKPAKRSLERLFDAGHLMVSERRNFQRIYDLAERVLPDGTDLSKPSARDYARFSIRRSVCDRGFVPWEQWGQSKSSSVRAALKDLVATGEFTRFTFQGAEYCAPASLVSASPSNRSEDPIHILSPFDGLLRERRRLSWLFDFECKLEAYFPESKRRWGYFCLPILWGNRFIGRLDPKADRKNRVLIVKKLMFEPGFEGFDETLPLFAAKLNAFAAFNGCEEIVIEDCHPKKLLREVRRETDGNQM